MGRKIDNARMEKVKSQDTFEDICTCINNSSKSFLWHCFIKDQQHSAFDAQRRNGDKLLQIDFSENYSCTQQNEVQSAHWNKKQITIFTAVFWSQDTTKSYAVISDNHDHCKVAVFAFLKTIFQDLKWAGLIANGDKIDLWSDGAASQFKNRFTLSTIEIFNATFDIAITWNFFASYHGKGAVDDVGGRLKQAANLHMRRGHVVSDLKSFVDAASNSRIVVKSVPNELIEQRGKEVEPHFARARRIAGIQKLHCFSSSAVGSLTAKVFTLSTENSSYRIA